MMTTVMVSTAGGLHELGSRRSSSLEGRDVTAAAARDGDVWALLDGRALWHRADDAAWQQVGVVDGPPATCLFPAAAGLLVGTAEAHLLVLDDGRLERVAAFDTTPGRDAWYTPWGGPPDTRSISGDGEALYVNVHVGGIVRSTDAGASWQPTIEIDADVHQVLLDPSSGLLLAATAGGLATSTDHGQTWTFATAGLHAPYQRAVAVAEDAVLASASTGPSGRQAALYRRPLAGDAPFARCRAGLPEWFDANIDTGCLAAAGPVAAFGTATGEVYLSEDGGLSWRRLASDLPPVRCVLLIENGA
jgi:hypothetical protein